MCHTRASTVRFLCVRFLFPARSLLPCTRNKPAEHRPVQEDPGPRPEGDEGRRPQAVGGG